MKRILAPIFDFYIEGFRSMTTGKILWTIILVKLAIMFFIIWPVCNAGVPPGRRTAEGNSVQIYEELVERCR